MNVYTVNNQTHLFTLEEFFLIVCIICKMKIVLYV